MSYTGQVTRTVIVDGASVTSTRSYTGQQLVKIAETVADGATDTAILVAVDVSQLRLAVFQSTVAMTIKTNDSVSPQETIVLAANIPRIFETGDVAMFGGDVSSFFVTNASGESGTLTFFAVSDL